MPLKFAGCSLLFSAITPVIAYGDVRISALDDISLGSWDGSSNLENSDAVCVYNSAGPNYDIILTGSGAGLGFELSNGGSPLPFEVDFAGSSGTYVAMTSNSAQQFSSANEVSSDCNSSTNAGIRVRILNSALRGARAGSYTGLLTIQVEPA